MLLRWPPRPSSGIPDPKVDTFSVEARAFNPVDVHVGARVRSKRMATGLSLRQMSALLGVGEKRLSEYETGETRITASDLAELARLLSERPSWFFSGGDARAQYAVAGSAEGLELMRLFVGVRNPRARRQILDFAAGLARAESGPAAKNEPSC